MNKLYKTKREEGFTIIEVLIVLAIAGLIILIVFLAVPALQRNSRNTQAKNEASSILGAVSEFVNNNNGKLPATGDSSATGTSDVNSVFSNAKLQNISSLSIKADASAAAKPESDKAVLVLKAKCSTPSIEESANVNTVVTSGAARQVALLYLTEDSKGNRISCQDS